jgi:long-chain-alcohol oxidase
MTLTTGPDGRTSPMWERAGFPGPPGPAEDAAEPAFEPIVPDRDTELDCDVVVVGSGAGGGTAAAVLAEAGLDVVVLEAGDYVRETELDGSEFQGYGSLYMNGGAMSTQDGGTGILAGATLGGGTTVNYTTAYRTPGAVRDEWARAGAAGVNGSAYDGSMDAVFDRLGVNDEHPWVNSRDALLQEAAVARGSASASRRAARAARCRPALRRRRPARGPCPRAALGSAGAAPRCRSRRAGR